MNQNLMLWPVVGHISLTILLYLHLTRVKVREIKAGTVNRKEVAANQDLWPLSVRLINNNLRNQFETPVLFYVISIMLMSLGKATHMTLAIAVVYVGLRCAHSVVHTTSNNVSLRMPIFALSVVLLIVLLGFALVGLWALS